MAEPIKVGLASYGMSGKVFHAPLLAADPRYKITRILERSKDLSRQDFPEATIVRRIEDLIHDPGTELIIVNTPDRTHAPFAWMALEAGKHVVVEKPFTLFLKEAEKLARLAERSGKVLTVYQNRRWDGGFLTLKKTLNEGRLGQVTEYEAHIDRYRLHPPMNSWKEDTSTGTGILYNLGSHLIDQCLVLFGVPRRVDAFLRTRRSDTRIPDYMLVILEYQGMMAALKASYLVREPGPRLCAHGTLGSYVKYSDDPQEEMLTRRTHRPGDPGYGREPSEAWGVLHTEAGGQIIRQAIETLPGNYPAFYDRLYHAITAGGPPPVSLPEALDTMRVIEACLKSNRKGKPVVP
jgi:scyllo-inositol 2-dehydrogenase (NADP+)